MKPLTDKEIEYFIERPVLCKELVEPLLKLLEKKEELLVALRLIKNSPIQYPKGIS